MKQLALLLLLVVVGVWGAEEEEHTTSHPQNVKLEQLREMEESSLMGWYHMVNAFLLVIKPDQRTLDYVINFILGKNELTPQEFVLELAKMNYAFLAMVVVGLAYVVVMLLSGLFFLSCRLCGRCGAKDSQKQRHSDNCWRTIHKFCLVLMVAFLVVPITCMCIINVHMAQSSPNVKGNISHVFDILQEFADSTDQEVDKAARAFNENPIQDFNEFKNSFVELVQENITNSVDHEKLEDIKDIVTWIASVEEKQAAVSNASELSRAVQHLKNSIAGVRRDVRSLYNCSTTPDKQVCQVDFRPLPLESINVDAAYSSLQKEFHKLLDINFEELTSVIDQIQNNTILRNKIEQESESLRKFADETMSEDKQDVEKIKKKVKFYTDTLRNLTKTGKEKVVKTFEETNESELYRYWGMFGLAGALLVPVVLLVLGLVCGCSGYEKERHPTKRSSLSNCGGCCLVLAVYCFFLVSSFLMVVTVGLFVVGGNLQAFGCIPLYQTDFSTLDEMKSKLTPLYNNTALAGVQPSKLLKGCKDNKSIIYALGLINESDPTSFEQFLKSSDVMSPENSAKIDGKLKEAIAEITSGFRDKLRHFTSALNITELRDIPAKLQNLLGSSRGNVSQFVESVRAALKRDLGEVEDLDGLIDDSVAALYAEMDQLQAKLSGFSSSLLKIYNEADNYQAKIQDIEKSLDIVEERLPKVIKAHLFYAVASSSGWKDMVEQIGKCFPVWVAFDISRIAVCEFVVYPINGFWFALGWALVVIIPTILFSVKLSRFYLRMKYDDDSYDADCGEAIPLDMARATTKPFSYTNPGAVNWMAMANEYEKYGGSNYRPEPHQFTPHPNYMVHPASSNQARHFHHK